MTGYMSARILRYAVFLKERFRRHWAVFVLAVLVGGIYGSHHIFIARILRAEGGTYRPLTFAAHADASVYGIRANAVYTGQWLAGDINDPERAANPSSLPLLNPIIMGGLGRLLGSLDRAFILSDFLFPPLIFIALYFLAFELVGSRTASVFFASFFIFIPKAILPIPPVSWPLLETFLQRVLPDASGILYFARFEYPKITFLFFAPALYGTLRAIRREERWSTWLAGISFGLMFYTYFYDWAYFFMGLIVMGVMLALSGQHRRSVRLAKIAGIGWILALPYWYNFFLLRQLPDYRDLAARIGVEVGWQFRWVSVWKSYLRIAALVAALGYVAPRRERAPFIYLAGLLAAFIAAVNMQVVLGFNVHPDHWYRVSFLPLGLAMLATGYWAAKRYAPAGALSYAVIAAVVGTMFLFGRSLVSQYAYSKQDAEFYMVEKPYAAAYAWLARQAPERARVGSVDYTTNNELMLYTPHHPFLLNGLHTTASDAKIWERLMQTGMIFGIPSEAFSALLKDKNEIFYLFLNEYGDNSFDSAFRNDARSERRIPDEVISRMTVAYERMRAEEKAEDIVLGMDYALAGPREEAIAPFRLLKNMEEVYGADGVRIYKIIKE